MKSISVKNLSGILKEKFEDNINDFYVVEGVVINKSDVRGNLWFSLKDLKESYTINSVIWRSTRENKNYDIEDGDVIIVSGKITMYDKNNSYKFSVFKMRNIETAESEFKKKLRYYERKNYFNKSNIVNKSEIKKVGLITSFEGQAINDFKKTLGNRFFNGEIFEYNVNVQGINCATDIISAINCFSKQENEIDLILITRGGGSKLDLDEFNNSNLIETIYKCKIPIYCAIGHEKDYSLCDYVCDLRSSTPTSLALEISEDYNKITNKVLFAFQEEIRTLNKCINDLKFKYSCDKSEFHNKTVNTNKPSGFYFNNQLIRNMKEFKSLCTEKFSILLEDGEIEFKIPEYKVVKLYHKKYTYDKYIKVYENPTYSDKKVVEKIESKKKKILCYNFGNKEHYILYSKIINTYSYFLSQLELIDSVEDKKRNFKIRESILKKTNTLNMIIKYKTHINYLQNAIDNDFQTFEGIQDYDEYVKYNIKDGLTVKLIRLYKGIKDVKAKYHKMS
jgi:exodeoxyribonuclease VII large subunit